MVFTLFKKKEPPKEEFKGFEIKPELLPMPVAPASEQLPVLEAQGLRPATPPPPPPSFEPQPVQPLTARQLPAGMPAPPIFKPEAPKPLSEEIEETAEAIIAEKWEKFKRELEEIRKIQDDFSASLSGLSERMTNIEKKMDMVIEQILGKVEEYSKGVQDVGVELKAMQKMFNTLMPTFTENIKELQELVERAKTEGLKRK
ncbi:MAG: hypothetical protein ACP5JY_02990 [Candidatus Nanoarchaeia archaeon]